MQPGDNAMAGPSPAWGSKGTTRLLTAAAAHLLLPWPERLIHYAGAAILALKHGCFLEPANQLPLLELLRHCPRAGTGAAWGRRCRC